MKSVKSNIQESQTRRKNKKLGGLSSENLIKNKRLSCYCVAKEYNLKEMASSFLDKTIIIYNSALGIKCTRDNPNRQFLQLLNYKFLNPFENSEILSDSFCYVFFFDYGVAVFWNMQEKEEKEILAQLKEYEVKSNPENENDHLTYEETKAYEDPMDPKAYVTSDHLVLCGNKFEEKLAVSFALAQSSKLDYFECDIECSIAESRALAEQLAKNGYINLPQKNLNKKIGKLHLKKNEINLDTDILDSPDYFWNNDKYYPHFSVIVKYLEINKRTDVINHRLNVIAELLYVLNEEVNFRHSCKLEWYIIVLILIYVLILFFWDILVVEILSK